MTNNHNKVIKRELSGKCKNCQKLMKVIARQTRHGNGKAPKQLFFDEKYLAVRWGLSVKQIQKMRYNGKGPEVTYFETAVRYRLRHIVSFERAHIFNSRSDRDTPRRSNR